MQNSCIIFNISTLLFASVCFSVPSSFSLGSLLFSLHTCIYLWYYINIICFHQVLATVADPNLGGRNFDELLRDHFIEEFKVGFVC